MERPNLDSRDLALLCALDEAGGVTRAGEVLGLSQSAVSHHLARIEDKVGQPLFRREGRGLKITPAGRILVDGGAEILLQLSALEQALRPPRNVRIRVATQCHTCYAWIAPVIGRFRRSHPDVQVIPTVRHRNDPLLALARKKVDVAIAHAPVLEGMRATKLGSDTFVVVLPLHHPHANVDAITPRHLVSEVLYVHELPVDELVAIGRDWFGKLTPAQTVRMPLTEAMVDLVAAGCGVALLPRWAAANALHRTDVVVRPFAPKKARRTWRAVTRDDDSDRPEVHALVAELATWFASASAH